MYIPANMEMKDQRAIADFIAEFGFALLLSPSLQASHLPMLYAPDEGQKGTLYGHMAKANGQWKDLENERVLVVFTGPHAYISPIWYANKPAVPTWNYAAVHCYGRVEILDIEQTVQALDALVGKYEPQILDEPELMPLQYRQKLSQAIVGFRVVVDDIQAKEKLGQHRKTQEQLGVYLALSESSQTNAVELSQYMKKRNLGTGS